MNAWDIPGIVTRNNSSPTTTLNICTQCQTKQLKFSCKPSLWLMYIACNKTVWGMVNIHRVTSIHDVASVRQKKKNLLLLNKEAGCAPWKFEQHILYRATLLMAHMWSAFDASHLSTASHQTYQNWILPKLHEIKRKFQMEQDTEQEMLTVSKATVSHSTNNKDYSSH